MEDLQQKILDLLANSKKSSLDTGAIVAGLHLGKGGNFASVSTALNQMEDQCQIVHNINGTWDLASVVNLYTGTLCVNTKGLGFVDKEDGTTVRFDARDQLDALNGDVVAYQAGPGQAYGHVIKVLQRAHVKVIGTYEGAYKPKLVLDDRKLQNKVLKVEGADKFNIIEGLKVQGTIVEYGNRYLRVRIDRAIGHKDDPGVDILSVLLDHDIEPAFPDEVMAEVNQIPQEVSEEEMAGRVDLRNDITVTIDGDDSKDFDDAVSVVKDGDGWLLKVSIADVQHYVKENSALDKEALKRGCSTYVTDRVVPMLPHQLSNGICSLNPHVVRLVNTCEMKIAHDGHIISYKTYPAVMRSTERMTYHNVNLILDGDKELCARYAHLGTLFTDLRDCADAIRAHRHDKGAIDFDTDEAEIKCDENGVPISITLRQRGHAECMVEDCMIAANVCVANQMKLADVPCVYRIHEAPEAKKLKSFVDTSFLLGHKFRPEHSVATPKEVQQYLESVKDSPEFPVLSMMLLRCMQKARYDVRPVGHFGLAEEDYLHFTSPIRRYPDLIVHRMLTKYVFNQCKDPDQIAKDTGSMQEFADQSSIRERASQDAEYECDDMKKAQFMEKHIGEKGEGLITGVTSFGFYVELPNTVEGLVHISHLNDDYYTYDEDRMELKGSHFKHVYQLGQTVKVVCLAASHDTRQIDFGIDGMKAAPQRNDRNNGGRNGYRKRRRDNRGRR